MEAQLTRTKVWSLARAQIVNRAREQFLSRPGLPKNQNCRISRGHSFDLLQYSSYRFAVADNFLEIELRFQLVFQILLLLCELVL